MEEVVITLTRCLDPQHSTTQATNHMAVTTRWATPRSTGEQEAVGTMVDHMVDPTTLPPTTTSCPARGSTRGRCSECTSTTISDWWRRYCMLD